MLIIDTHSHIYAENDVQYPPVDKPIRPPESCGGVNRLEALARENSVAGVCIIQPGSYYRWDNRFIGNVSKAHPQDMAGICALDPDDAHSPDLLKEYVTDYEVRGLRSYPASDGHLDHPGVQALWMEAEQLGITVNVIVNTDQQGERARMLERFPRLPIVIDHRIGSGRCGKRERSRANGPELMVQGQIVDPHGCGARSVQGCW